jgi:hypothetical protein
LVPAEFYGEGCDASSYVTVDVGIEKPSSLSKEFDFSCPSPEKEKDVEDDTVAPVEDKVIAVEEAVVDVAPLAEATVDVAPAAEVADDVAL